MALLNKNDTKEAWMEGIFKDYPDLKGDTLKRHFIEQMIDAYQADEKKFKAEAYKAKKENLDVFKQAPDEIVAISKIEDKSEPQVTVTFEDDDNKTE
jgi:hypothetical protein